MSGAPRALRGLLLAFLFFSCAFLWRPYLRWETFHVQKIDDHFFFIHEDPRHPAFRRLLKSEGIGELIAGRSDELEIFGALLSWSSSLFASTSPFPNYPPWDAEEILKRIRSGKTGGFCAQYAIILGQVLQGLGFPVRFVDVAGPNFEFSHFTLEVYSARLGKWILLEPQYGFYYVDPSGSPLGALDVYREVTSKGKNPPRVFCSLRGRDISGNLLLYHHIRFHLRNNFLSSPVLHFRDYKAGTIAFSPCLMFWEGLDTPSRPGRGTQDAEIFNFIPRMGSGSPVRFWTARGALWRLTRMAPGDVVKLRLPARTLEQLNRMLYDVPEDYVPLM